MKFAAPYWKRLTFGILCGMLVGGSLFMALLILPQLVGIVDSGSGSGATAARKNAVAEEARTINAITADGTLSESEKIRRIENVLKPAPDADPKLTKLL